MTLSESRFKLDHQITKSGMIQHLKKTLRNLQEILNCLKNIETSNLVIKSDQRMEKSGSSLRALKEKKRTVFSFKFPTKDKE